MGCGDGPRGKRMGWMDQTGWEGVFSSGGGGGPWVYPPVGGRAMSRDAYSDLEICLGGRGADGTAVERGRINFAYKSVYKS